MSSKPKNGWSTADFDHAGTATSVEPLYDRVNDALAEMGVRSAPANFRVIVGSNYVGDIRTLPEESGVQYTDAGYVVDFDVDTVTVRSAPGRYMVTDA